MNSGVETTPAEAKEMLEAYARTYPNVDAWLRERDGQVRAWVDNPPEVDWDASMKLLKLWQLAEGKRRALRRKLGHWPSGAELAEAVTSSALTLGESAEAVDHDQLARDLDWAFGFDAAVALGPDGAPIAFEGANKPLKVAFVRRMLDTFGTSAGRWLLTEALREQIRTMSTKFRNQPIQGLVADIVLDAYGDLHHRRLPKFPGAVPVTSIHDSIVLECDEADAPALAAELQDALESAMKRWCPDVPAKADCDIRRSFDDSSTVTSTAALAA